MAGGSPRPRMARGAAVTESIAQAVEIHAEDTPKRAAYRLAASIIGYELNHEGVASAPPFGDLPQPFYGTMLHELGKIHAALLRAANPEEHQLARPAMPATCPHCDQQAHPGYGCLEAPPPEIPGACNALVPHPYAQTPARCGEPAERCAHHQGKKDGRP